MRCLAMGWAAGLAAGMAGAATPGLAEAPAAIALPPGAPPAQACDPGDDLPGRWRLQAAASAPAVIDAGAPAAAPRAASASAPASSPASASAPVPEPAPEPGSDPAARPPTALVQLAEEALITPGQPFAIWLRLCLPATLPLVRGPGLSADMPAHRHGMNYAPRLQAVAPGLWRAEGLVMHMPGRWRWLVDLGVALPPRRGASGSEAPVQSLRLQQTVWVR